jgi:predicted MPP superfamily phosphohydrolase
MNEDAYPPVAHPPGRALLRPGVTRRVILRSFAGLGLAGIATAAYGIGIEPESILVTRYRLTPPRWPAGQRLSIHVIADLHAGGPNMTARHIDRVVDIANLEGADLVLLLGDYFATHRFVTEHVPGPVWAASLARLRSRLGTWAIFGNHDWWHDIKGVRAALARVGIPTLENRAVRLGELGERFWLAGLGDQLAHPLGHHRFRGEDDLAGTLRQVDNDDPVILAVHEPDIFTQVPERVSLTLAGHTHGGQIRVPFLWERYVPSAYGARFAYGHVVEQGRHLIVSGGLGVSNIPVRIGVPPEIVRIELG